MLIDKPTSGAIFLGEEFEGAGETFLFLKVAREHGLEGMVSKRVDLAVSRPCVPGEAMTGRSVRSRPTRFSFSIA